MKKVCGVTLVILMFIMAVTGCSTKDNIATKADKASEGDISMGRYVEKDMVFPQGVTSGEFISITTSPNGDIELYAYNDGVYEKYSYKDGDWSKADAEALQKFNDITTNSIFIRNVFYGEDKKQYLLGDTHTDYHNVLYRQADTGVFEKVEIKRFEETYEEWQNIPWRPAVLKVLENGMIAAAYPWKTIEVYSSDGQSVIKEYSGGKSCLMAAEGNILYYTDQNDKEILSTNIETKEEGNPRAIDINVFDSGKLELGGGSAYVCNTKGIHLNMEGASLWETLIDGYQSSLGMPSITLIDFVAGTTEDYYIVLSNMDRSDISIKHIFYDETVSSVPPIELSIFSIDDNPTIRQAISIFQSSHPEVRVNFRTANIDNKVTYTYGLKNPEQTITLTDQMNALNTELLAGRGADILVLDGIPIGPYIDKGVLEDMGSIFTPMKESGELLPNITDPYNSEGKVYAMPIRFKLPVIYGALDAVNAAASVTELSEYARNSNEIPVLGPSNYRALAAWFFMTYYDEILGQDKEIDEAALQAFLENINLISEAIHASDDVEVDYMNTSQGRTWGYWIATSIKAYQKQYQTSIEELGGISSFSMPLKVVNEWQGAFGVINHSFKAKGLIGINSASSQKELAKEFIQLLFSGEIQKLDLMDGFPVNQAAMDEWIQTNKEDYGFTVGDGEIMIQSSYPDQKSRKSIYESICAADQPMVNDITMIDMILDEAEKYLRGDITSEQAASDAVASINLYLSE